MGYDDDFRDATSIPNHMRAASPVLFWVLVVTVVAVALTAVGYLTKPLWLSMEREAYQNSHQYVDSHTTAILKLVESHATAEKQIVTYKIQMQRMSAAAQKESGLLGLIKSTEAQQAAFVSQIRQKAQTMPDEEIPQAALPFLKPGQMGR